MHNQDQFMRLALSEAKKALNDGEFPVGCVFVLDDEVIAKGRRKNSSGPQENELDHAEITALRTILQIKPMPDLSEMTVYSTMEPCLMCFSSMLLSGIRNYVWAYEDIMGGGTNLPLKLLNPFYSGMKVKLIGNVQRAESLRLFQDFFRKYTYLQNSLLARYTLEQHLEHKP